MALRSDRRVTGPPDFVGVGAFRSATAGWFGLLLEHPDIEPGAGADTQEHFFDEFCAREMGDADIERYHALFPRRRGALCGEWRPRYMYDPWTPRLLARAAPDARLLVMLGDPIERYRVSLASEELASRIDDERYMADIVGRGRYGTQLRRLRDHFDESRVLVLQHERCRCDPVGEYQRTLRFLGLVDETVPRRLRVWRESADDRDLRFPTRAEVAKRRLLWAARRRREAAPAPLWPDLEAALHEELDAEVAELRLLVPDLDLSLWPNFADVGFASGPPHPVTPPSGS
jgi:hypothetical protein